MIEKLERYSNPREFADAVVPFLQQDEALYNLPLSVIDTLTRRPEVFKEYHLAAFKDATGSITGAVWMVPPYPFGMTNLTEVQSSLAVDLAKAFDPLPDSIFGTASTPESFKNLWIQETQRPVTSSMALRMFEAKQVIDPLPVAGYWRLATTMDLSILSEWTHHYSIDVHEPLTREQAKTNAEQSIKYQTRFIWEVDKTPVTMAGCIPTSQASARLAWVFTPTEFRGRGYASNLVARITEAQLDSGKRVFLYTDLSNPTSNKIYQNIGYQPLFESRKYVF
ncbi:MAG: GNAT family N-acetyltransferase [Proteobacteria bacterium]|nr:GNAT family N-acetyltransferase [Pseudomonadota bacterium]